MRQTSSCNSAMSSVWSATTLLVAALLLVGGIAEPLAAGEHDKMEKGRAFQWSEAWTAKEAATKSLYGILYYVPPKDSQEIHVSFETQMLFEQSLRSPVVRVKTGEERTKFRKHYGVNPDRFVLVLTDWNGNEMNRYEAKKKEQKLPISKIVSDLNNARKFVDKLKKDIAKQWGKASKAFDKKKYKKALKELTTLVKVQGHKEGEKARAMLSDIEDVGRRKIRDANELAKTDVDGATSALKKIERDFAGCAVGAEAKSALAKLPKS